MKRKLFFLALVVVFTVLGGGRTGDWFILCTDQDGWAYEVDNRSVEILPDGEVALRVRVAKGSHLRSGRWLINPASNTLRVDSEPPSEIQAGSVASRALVYLREQGLLKATSLSVSREPVP